MNAPKIRLPKSSVIFAVFVFLLEICAFAERQSPEKLKLRLARDYGKIPVHFEANCGQTDSQVKFLARGRGYGLFLTATEAVIELRNAGLSSSENRHLKTETRDSKLETVLRMKLVGASTAAKVEGIHQLPGRSNYFIGNDSKKWHSDIPTYARVRYSQIYPGIDLVYYGNQNQLEYDFVIRPGSDPGRIALDVQGADKVEVGPQGDLLLRAAGAVMSQRKPTVYQEIDGIRREVSGSYVVEGEHRLRFRVADYDSGKPLVIDPTLDYSTYIGGSGRDQGFAITVDAGGNAYVTGETTSLNFPVTAGSAQTSFGGGLSVADAFVAKLDPTGSSLLYSTYLGGSGRDQGFGIAVDADGNAYVAGLTLSTNFPTTPGALKTTLGGVEDAFVTKLNTTGSALVYSTLLGGSSTDFALGIALDAAGSAYVTGGTTSMDFPVSAGAFRTSFGGSTDAFVTKLNPSGSAILYSTYVGGSGFDQGLGIKVDAAGSAYVTGETTSANFPTSSGAAQTVFGGVRDGFVVKLNPTASAVVYSTFLGGSNFDRGLGIAVDTGGNAYVTGETTSTNFPTTAGAHQTVSGGGDDAFVSKLKFDGSALDYSTYLGGTSFDFGEGIAVDSAGNAYVTGGTKSPNFPTTADAQQPALAGSDDAFITRLDAAGSVLIYSTYVGGAGSDEGFSIAIDSTGAAYVTGETASSNFPTTSGAFQSAWGGIMDAFVVKIAGAALPPTITCTANITTSTAPGECSRVVDFALPSGSSGSTVSCSPASGSVFQKGATTVTCTATDSAGGTANCSFTVTVNDNEAPAITCPANVTMAATSAAGVMVSYPAPSVSDNCPGATVSSTPASGSIFSVGATPVIATATDASGNTSTCTFTVTVTAPLTIICPAPILKSTDPGKCSAVVNYPAATTSGGLGAVSISYSQPSGSAFLKGTTTVTAMATDSAGNTATCSFTVTVMDTEPPTIVCPANITTSTDPGQPTAQVTFAAPAADNCSDVTVTFNPPSGSIFPQGTTTVIAIATDASGNTASCSFTVTVIDKEPPKIACPPDMTAFQDSAFGATVNYPSPEATDNSPGVTVACTPPSGSVLHLGATTVTCTATDTSGNTAACKFTVTVIPPPSTSGAKVTGGGSILTAEAEATFAFEAMVKEGVPSGSLIYQDHMMGLTVRSTLITAVQVTETHARIIGKAKINQLGSFDFVVDVDDLGEPGKGSDTFRIQLSNGYTAGGILAGGNVQIH